MTTDHAATTPTANDAFYLGKRVLITGATRGIGEAIARQLAGAGATVLATARSVASAGEAASRCWRPTRVRPTLHGGIVCDLAKRRAARR
jgi:NAD(P)-dependent dehydrogenase (short-subunit alcohol dehydrogenase family)